MALNHNPPKKPWVVLKDPSYDLSAVVGQLPAEYATGTARGQS